MNEVLEVPIAITMADGTPARAVFVGAKAAAAWTADDVLRLFAACCAAIAATPQLFIYALEPRQPDGTVRLSVRIEGAIAVAGPLAIPETALVGARARCLDAVLKAARLELGDAGTDAPRGYPRNSSER